MKGKANIAMALKQMIVTAKESNIRMSLKLSGHILFSTRVRAIDI